MMAGAGARIRGLGAGRGALLATVIVVLAVLLTRWPAWPLVPDALIDADWMLALNVAQQDGWRWGSQVVFTYGPLGYTIAPELPGILRILVASALFALGVTCTVVWLIELLRPRMGVAGAAVAAAVAAYLLFSFQLFGEGGLLVPVLVGSLVSIRGASLARLAVIGCLVGLLGHQALSAAAVGGVVAVVAAFGARGARGSATVAAAAGTTWLAVWLLSGQAVGDLPAFVTGAWQVVTGYSLAMTLEMSEVRWTYAAAALTGIVLLVLAISVARELPRRAGAALVAAVAIAGWWAMKEGFTRHDVGHTAVAFAVVATVALTLALVATTKRSRAIGVVLVVACTTVICLPGWPGIAPDPREGLAGFGRVASAVADPASGREQAEAAYAALLPPSGTARLRAEVAGRETLADPLGIGVVLGLGGTAAPLPPLELYSSYTPGLDARNAESLAGRPRQVLRAVPYRSIDERNPYWDSPDYQRAIYCRYAAVIDTPSWILLRPAGTDRCRDEVPGASVEAAQGQAVTVPRRDGAITLVTIEPHPSLLWQAARLLLKVRPVHIVYGDKSYRLAESPTADGLMLNAPVPDPAFRELPGQPHPTISVDVASTLTFSFVPVAPRTP